MKKEMTKRAKQAEATKQKIYKTAIKLFKKNGYQKVSVEEIAKKADVGIGTFYHYYESKMSLFMEIFVQVQDYLGEFDSMDLSEKQPYQVFQSYFSQYAMLHEDAGLELIQGLTDPKNRKFLNDNQDFENTVTKMIIYYQKNKIIPEEEKADDIKDIFFMIARGVMMDWAMKEGAYPLKRKMEYVMGKILSVYGIIPEKNI